MGARDGASYIAGLKDGREVWLNGKRIADVTEHPDIRPAIDATARLYDLQHDPAHRDVLTCEVPGVAGRVGRMYQAPRKLEDLVARREAVTLWMDQSCGFLGRAPDFLNTTLAALKTQSRFFAQQSVERQNAVEGYYAHAAAHDLFLTHALHEPQVDRAKRRSQQPDGGTALRVIKETTKGLIVSGAKTVATGAAYADDVIMWPTVPNWGPGDEPYALACAIPIASPGLKLVCRSSFTRTGPRADYPISSQFDEMDSVLLFDNVLVPWDRVFLHGDLALIGKMYPSCRIRDLTAHQTTVRLLVKMEFLYALLVRMSEAIGVDALPPIAMTIGEAAAYVEIIRSSIMASEYGAKHDDATGVLYPDFSAIFLGRIMGPRLHPEFITKIRRLGASGLVQVPSSIADFDSPIGAELEKVYRGANISAREKTVLMRLAWDICGSELGSRHSLYEMYYGGDPDKNLITYQQEYVRKDAHLKKFDRFFKSLVDDPNPATPVKLEAAHG